MSYQRKLILGCPLCHGPFLNEMSIINSILNYNLIYDVNPTILQPALAHMKYNHMLFIDKNHLNWDQIISLSLKSQTLINNT